MLIKAYVILYVEPTTHARSFLKNMTTNANGFEFKVKQVLSSMENCFSSEKDSMKGDDVNTFWLTPLNLY